MIVMQREVLISPRMVAAVIEPRHGEMSSIGFRPSGGGTTFTVPWEGTTTTGTPIVGRVLVMTVLDHDAICARAVWMMGTVATSTMAIASA